MCREDGDCMKNITLAINEDLLKAGREYALRHRISFNALVRRLIEQTVHAERNNWLQETFSLMDSLQIADDAGTWTREELHRGENIL